MGDLLQSLGNVLGGGGQQPPGPTSPADMIGMGGFAGPVGVDPSISQQIANSYPQDVQDVAPENPEAVVRGWKPKKVTFLGALADAYLMSKGMKPAFRERTEKYNMQEAMEGFTQEPLQAIRRIAQINPDAAWQLYNQYTDNARAERIAQRQEQIFEMKNTEEVYDRVASLLGAATDENRPRMVELAKRLAASRGVELPFNLDDPEAINALRYGAVPVDSQIDNERDANYKNTRTRQMQESIDNREAYQSESLRERSRHNRVMENRPTKSAASSKPKEGEERLDPSGSGNMARYEGGKWRYYKKISDNPVKYQLVR